MKILLLTLPSLSWSFQVQSPIPGGFRSAAVTSKRPRSNPALSALAMDGAASAIDSFFQTQPYMSAFLTCSFKASAADFVAQTRSDDDAIDGDVDSAAPVDVSRNLAFVVYGGIYQGLFQEYLYSNIFPSWFTDNSWQTVATQVALDMAIISPFLCLPVAYLVKTVFTSDQIHLPTTLQHALTHYVHDVKERGLLFKYWGLWIPVQSLTFSVIPHHYRIAFIACVSFVWMFILSTTSSTLSTQAKPKSS